MASSELSTTWKPRLQLQSFCTNASSVCTLHLTTPFSPSSSSSLETPRPSNHILFSSSGGSLFAVVIPSSQESVSSSLGSSSHLSRSLHNGSPLSSHSSSSDGSTEVPSFLSSPAPAPQRLIDEEVEEGVTSFTVFPMPSSIFMKKRRFYPEKSCEAGDLHREKRSNEEGSSQSTSAASFFSSSSSSSVPSREGILITAGASTGMIRCYRVYVQQRRERSLTEREQEGEKESKGMQLLKSMQEKRGLQTNREETEEERKLRAFNSDEDGTGKWMKMQEFHKWRGGSSAGVVRVLEVSPFFSLPFLLLRGGLLRKALCRCLAVGTSDGSVDCHVFLFLLDPSSSSPPKKPREEEKMKREKNEGGVDQTRGGENKREKEKKGREQRRRAGEREEEEGEEEESLVDSQKVEMLPQSFFSFKLNGEGVAVLRFHPSRFILACGGDRGSLRVIDLSPSLFHILSATSGRDRFLSHSSSSFLRPYLSSTSSVCTLEDHISAINALEFIPSFPERSEEEEEDARSPCSLQKNPKMKNTDEKLSSKEKEKKEEEIPQVGYLASCGGDKLLNFWNLNSFSPFHGCLETVADLLRECEEESKKKKKSQEGIGEGAKRLLPWKQIPTEELLTALLYYDGHPFEVKRRRDRKEKKKKQIHGDRKTDEDEEEAYLFAGGEEGLLHIWSLKSLQIIQSFPLPTQSSPAARASLIGEEESSLPSSSSSKDLNAFIRSFRLLLSSSSSSARLLISQDSNILSLFSLSSSSSVLSSSLPFSLNSKMSSLPRHRLSFTEKNKKEKKKLHTGEEESDKDEEKEEEEEETRERDGESMNEEEEDSSFLVGQLEGIFACKFLPRPPSACACICCRERRIYLDEEEAPSRGTVRRNNGECGEEEGDTGKKRKASDDGGDFSLANNEKAPLSLSSSSSSVCSRHAVTLVGERQPWILRLDAASQGRPIAWSRHRRGQFAACGGGRDRDREGLRKKKKKRDGKEEEESKEEIKGVEKVLEGHEEPATCCDVSRHGCWVLTGSSDSSVALWHVSSRSLVARVPTGHHEGPINAVAFQQKQWHRPSPLLKKSLRLLSSSCSSSTSSSSSSTSKEERKKQTDSTSSSSGEEPSSQMLCACDCRGISSSTPHSILFASASAKDHALKVWKAEIPPNLFFPSSSLSQEINQKKKEKRSDVGQVEGGVCTPQVLMTSLASVVAHRKEINDMQISPNDSVLCTVSSDKTGKLFTFPSLSYVGELRGHTRAVLSCRFSTREKVLATSSADGTVKLWSVQTLHCLRTFQSTSGGGSGAILALRFLSCDTQIMTANSEGSLRLWNCRTAECVSTLPAVHTDKIWSMDICGPGMLTGGADGSVCLWEDFTSIQHQQAQMDQIREMQELAAIKLLIAEGRGREVFKLLLKIKRKTSMKEFLETYFSKLLIKAFERGFLPLYHDLSTRASSPHLPTSIGPNSKASSLLTFLDTYGVRTPEGKGRVIIQRGLTRGSSPREKETKKKKIHSDGEEEDEREKKESSLKGYEKKKEETSLLLPSSFSLLSEEDDQLHLKDILQDLSPREMKTLLEFACDWTSNTHTAWLGQGILNLLLQLQGGLSFLSSMFPSSFSFFSSSLERHDERRKRRRKATREDQEDEEEVRQLLQAFQAYTQRHEKRLSALVEKSFLLDLLLGCGDDDRPMSDEGMIEVRGEEDHKKKKNVLKGRTVMAIEEGSETENGEKEEEMTKQEEEEKRKKKRERERLGHDRGTAFTRQCLYGNEEDEEEEKEKEERKKMNMNIMNGEEEEDEEDEEEEEDGEEEEGEEEEGEEEGGGEEESEEDEEE